VEDRCTDADGEENRRDSPPIIDFLEIGDADGSGDEEDDDGLGLKSWSEDP